ncbi:MAG: ATP-binding protein [Candidatus Methylomirabilales bacterium]
MLSGRHAGAGDAGVRVARPVNQGSAQEPSDLRARQLEAVSLLTAELIREPDVDLLLLHIIRRAAELLGGGLGCLGLWDEARGVVAPRAWWGLGDWLRDAVFPPGQGVAGFVAQHRRGLVVNDYPQWALASPTILRHARVTAALAEPLLYRDEFLGMLLVASEEPGRAFSREDQQVLALFAAEAGIAIAIARLHAEARQQAARLEARVAERTRELEELNGRLAAASQHKSAFLSSMSHELRTPLNSILGFSQLLLQQGDGLPPDRQRRYLHNIHRSGQHLLRLVSDILDLGRVEAGRLVLHPEPLDPSAVLAEILALVRGAAAEKALALEVELPPGLPCVRADRTRFQQICLNLLGNAVKFTPAGGRVTVRARRISDFRLPISDSQPNPSAELAAVRSNLQSGISNLKSGDYLEIAVTDTGPGIRAEDLGRLFKEFVQLETTQAQSHEGAGLGLALTRRLVELHGGDIRAESEGPGRGSTFRVRLPAVPGAPAPQDAAKDCA